MIDIEALLVLQWLGLLFYRVAKLMFQGSLSTLWRLLFSLRSRTSFTLQEPDVSWVPRKVNKSSLHTEETKEEDDDVVVEGVGSLYFSKWGSDGT